jgi:hypothetical protein
MTVGNPKSSKKMGCSKTVFNRVSCVLLSQRSFTRAPLTNQIDSLKIKGPADLQFHERIRVSLVFISIRVANFLEESQEEPFQRSTHLIPEAGWHAPESGFQSFTENEQGTASLWKINKNKGILTGGPVSERLPACIVIVSGRIPDDDLHESSSEGEGACSGTCDGRSLLPLRGKLGWMTPRPGQKKTGKRNASFGALVPKRGPHTFSRFGDRTALLCAL